MARKPRYSIENLPNDSLLKHLPKEVIAEMTQGLYDRKPLLGEGGILTKLIKELTQATLEAEMQTHLEEESLEHEGNRRNGYGNKTVKTSTAQFDLAVPRDRNCSFEPQIIKKRQTILNEELENKILALYSLGTSYDGIACHLQDIYGVEVSDATRMAVKASRRAIRCSISRCNVF